MNNRALRIRLSLAVLVALGLLAGCSGKQERISKHMERAHEYFIASDLEKARVEFKNVLQMDPKNIEALYGQAQVHEKLEKWRIAVGLYQRVLELDGTQLNAKGRLARIMFMGGALEQAAKLADEILAVKANDVTALTVKGGVLAQKGDVDAAAVLVDKALAAEPGDLDASMLQASILVQKKQANEALQVLENSLKVNVDSPDIISVMARINAGLGQEEKATSLLRQLVDGHPDNMLYRKQLVSYYVRLKKNDQAEGVLREGVSQAPEQNEPKLLLVDFLLKTAGADKALEELRKFIANTPDSTELHLALGRLYEADGKKDEAKSELTALVSGHGVEPDALKARLLLARLAMADSDANEARRLVDEVLKENPHDNDGLLFHGKLALLEKDVPGAIADLRAVLRDQPNSVEVLTLLGRAHLANKEVELAKEQFEKAIALNENSAPLRFDIGQAYLQAGQTDAALQQLEAVSREPGAKAGVFEALFKAQMQKKDFTAARATAKQVEKNPQNPGLGEYLAGQVDAVEGSFVSAVKHFKAALAKAPETVEPLSALVKSRLALKQVTEAVADVDAVLKAHPQHYAAQNILGELYLLQKKPQDAAAKFRDALKLNPAVATFYRNLAAAQVQLGDRDGAINTLEKGLQAATHSEPIAVDLAAMQEKAGHVDTAIKVYETALAKEPKSMAMANNLAMILVNNKKDPASLERAGKLIETLTGTENPAYLDTMGWVHYSKGEVEQALPLLQQAASAAAGQPLMKYHLGMAQFKKGDHAAARQSLQSALDVKGDFDGRDEAKATLQQIIAGG